MGSGLGQYIPLALYILFLSACVLALAWRPTLGLYVLILVIPQQRLRARISDLPLGKHIIVLLLFSVLIGALIRGQTPRRSALNKILIGFMAFTFVSLCLGAFYQSGTGPFFERLLHWKDYMVLPLLFFATSAAIQTRQHFKIALVLVCFSILLVGRGFALEVHEHDFSHFDENKRDVGPLGAGSNQTAAFEAQTAIVLLALANGRKKRSHKLLLYAMIALNVYCLLYSFSRGGYIGFLIAFFVFALVRQPKLLPLLLVFFLAWQALVPKAVVERVTMTTDDSGQLETSAASRITLWNDALELIASNPVLGSGYDTYEYMGRVGSLRDTHNYYVKVMVETGIIGLGFLLLTLIKFWQMSWSLYRREQDALFSSLGLGLGLCTVCIAVVNFFGDRWTYVEINGLVWILFGLLAFAYHEVDTAPSALRASSSGGILTVNTGAYDSRGALARELSKRFQVRSSSCRNQFLGVVI